MNLLAAVHGALERHGIAHAVIGAAAMAVHGVVRSTVDLDLLTVDPGCLEPDLWQELSLQGTRVDIRRGDADDPLVGVVRLKTEGARDVDLVVGRGAWQRDILLRAQRALVSGVELPVATAADLVLLKLYAAGPQDCWDVEQLLAAGERATLVGAVERSLPGLPEQCRQLWRGIRGR